MTPNKIPPCPRFYRALENHEAEWHERVCWFIGRKAIDDLCSGDRWTPEELAAMAARR